MSVDVLATDNDDRQEGPTADIRQKYGMTNNVSTPETKITSKYIYV